MALQLMDNDEKQTCGHGGWKRAGDCDSSRGDAGNRELESEASSQR